MPQLLLGLDYQESHLGRVELLRVVPLEPSMAAVLLNGWLKGPLVSALQEWLVP